MEESEIKEMALKREAQVLGIKTEKEKKVNQRGKRKKCKLGEQENRKTERQKKREGK